ncbi:MAG: type VI secretion system tip protein VgrG [Chitinophagales bacterium]
MAAAPRTIPTSQIPDVVTYSIKINGVEVPYSIVATSIYVHKELNRIAYAKLKISDGDPSAENFPISNEEYFIPGNEIEIEIGYRSDNTVVFKGIITSHANKISSTSSELIIECKDKVVKLTIGKKNKYYENVTDSDIADEIIASYGLESEVETSAITHKQAVQYNSTDWDFLVSRMDVIGNICLTDDGKIIIKKPDLTAAPVLDLLFGATILEYNAEIDARTQFNEVKSITWDPAAQETVEETADDPGVQELGNLSNSVLADVIGLESNELIHSVKPETNAAKEWANAKLLKSRLAKMRGKVKCIGFPGVKPGDVISLNGVGERFSGPVFVSAVKHDFVRGDWTTEISFGMPHEWFTESLPTNHLSAQIGLLPAVQGLQVGVVTDLEDPDGEHRVKVKLPVVNNNEEGFWMRIATLDAGNNRGTFFRPEIGDEVIVGFIFNDVNHPVILGMLHSSALAAPLTASNDNHEKGYVSRSEMKMMFNDDEKSFKLETPAGKKFTISEKDGIIKLEDENGNNIKMESSGVTIESASSLKIKAATDIILEAVNISLSPSSQFSVSAAGSEIKAGPGSVEMKSATVKLEGSGIAEIKGGLVKIN